MLSLKKTFTSPDLPLLDLLTQIGKGQIQIPEFQRGWIWDDEHIHKNWKPYNTNPKKSGVSTIIKCLSTRYTI